MHNNDDLYVDAAIREIEGLIEQSKCYDPMRMAALKMSAYALRSTKRVSLEIAEKALEIRIRIASEAKSDSAGYRLGHLIGLGEELIGRWPEVREAFRKARLYDDM